MSGYSGHLEFLVQGGQGGHLDVLDVFDFLVHFVGVVDRISCSRANVFT